MALELALELALEMELEEETDEHTIAIAEYKNRTRQKNRLVNAYKMQRNDVTWMALKLARWWRADGSRACAELNIFARTFFDTGGLFFYRHWRNNGGPFGMIKKLFRRLGNWVSYFLLSHSWCRWSQWHWMMPNHRGFPGSCSQGMNMQAKQSLQYVCWVQYRSWM